MGSSMLGLPLEEALRRLDALGVEPTVTESCAPRRNPGEGALRVVRQSEDGSELTVCAFQLDIKANAKAAQGMRAVEGIGDGSQT